MTLKYFDLSLRSLDTYNLLIHGDTGVGKTHLIGDMLKAEKESGEILFVNIAGQDGWTSVPEGLDKCGVTAETFADLKQLVAQLRAKPMRAVGIDTAKDVMRLIRLHITGGDDRELKIGDFKDNEYAKFNREVDAFFMSLRGIAKYVMVTCTSDRSTDYLATGKAEPRITPDAASTRHSNQLGQHFDFVFFLEVTGSAAPMGPGKSPIIYRQIRTFDPKIVTRARLPRPLPITILIPDGGGGWRKIQEAINETFTKGGSK